MGVEKISGIHGALARQLQGLDTQQPVSSGHIYTVTVSCHNLSRSLISSTRQGFSLPDSQHFTVEPGLSHRPGIECPYLPPQILGTALPIHNRLTLVQLGRILSLGVILDFCLETAICNTRQGFQQGLSAEW